jgi:hypothetical protein
MNIWYSRPVFFVESVERSIVFYIEMLGFTVGSRYEEEGEILVAQVNREGCEILLNCQQPEKILLSDHPKPASDYHLKTGQRE